MKLDLKKLGILGVVLLATISISSCLNNDDELPNLEEKAWGVFINASPNSENLRFYSDGEVINSSGMDYDELYGYLNFDEGAKTITVKSSGNENNLDTLSLNMVKNKIYSIFAINSAENLELISYDDSYTAPAATKAKIRFIQLSPDAPRIRVAIENNEEFFGEFDFKQASFFQDISETLNKNMYLINMETSDTIFTKEINLERGRIYSIYSKGFINTEIEEQKLDIAIIPINQ